MRKHLFAALLFCLIPATVAVAQTQTVYNGVNQGDWAVAVVRSLNLDAGQELLKVEDFTALLQKAGIAPAGGWKVDQKLSYEDFIGTIGQSLLYINSKNSGERESTFSGFLAFLETRIGISAAQLLANLPRTGNFQGLNEGITRYLEQKQAAEGSAESAQSPAGSAESPANKLKAGAGTQVSLAAQTTISTVITSLTNALTVQAGGPGGPGTDYWNVFSSPASPILPYVAP